MKVKTCFDADAGISDHLICDVNYKYKHALLRTASSSASMNHPPFSEDEVTTSATMTISQRLLSEILATVVEQYIKAPLPIHISIRKHLPKFIKKQYPGIRVRVRVRVKQLGNANGLLIPRYATEQSAGLDLPAAIENNIVIKAGNTEIIPTGIAIALPAGYEAQIRPRSGLAAKHGITVLNSPGTIDADYRGEIKAILINHSTEDFTITRGMRIAQMVIAKYEHVQFHEVETIEDTQRGASGFGSTGK